MRPYIISCFFSFVFSSAFAQYEVKGTVYDGGQVNYVEGVRVVSTAGIFAITDTMGRYSITVRDGDSLYFVYNNKPTIKFPVKDITDPLAFNLSIKANVPSKYKVLKEVVVYSKSYREDSMENRETYSAVFNYLKPGLYVSSTGEGCGFDLDQIINIFRVNRNKRIKAFQERLQEQEKEKYVNARFGRVYVSRISGLKENHLDSFMLWYRPSYDFCVNSGELAFIQYILKASDHYRFTEGLPARKPGE